MFQALQLLLANTTGIEVHIVPDGADLKVIVYPKAGPKGDKLLQQPLVLHAAAADLDEGFVEAITSFDTQRRSLAEQIEATRLITASNEAKLVKKAATRSGAPALPAPKADVSLKSSGDDRDQDGGEDEGANATTNGVVLPASDGKPEDSVINDLSALLL